MDKRTDRALLVSQNLFTQINITITLAGEVDRKLNTSMMTISSNYEKLHDLSYTIVWKK
jgi:hypothetical protein